MPWLTVHGRDPDRLERWATYLLPPNDMGQGYDSVAGDVSSRLRVLDARTFEVEASIVTLYHRLRRGPLPRPQGPRPDQVSRHKLRVGEMGAHSIVPLYRAGLGKIQPSTV